MSYGGFGGFGSSIGGFFGGIGSSIGRFGGSLYNGISSGISTIGGWGMQLGSGISNWAGDSYRSSMDSMRSMMSSFRQTMGDFRSGMGSTFSSISSSIGLGSGGIGSMGSYFNQLDAFKWSAKKTSNLMDIFNKDRVEAGFKWIPFTPFFHTGIKIISSEYGVRAWGFNPNKFSFDILLGKTVPGRVYINERYDFTLPVSSNYKYTKILFQNLKAQ